MMGQYKQMELPKMGREEAVRQIESNMIKLSSLGLPFIESQNGKDEDTLAREMNVRDSVWVEHIEWAMAMRDKTRKFYEKQISKHNKNG